MGTGEGTGRKISNDPARYLRRGGSPPAAEGRSPGRTRTARDFREAHVDARGYVDFREAEPAAGAAPRDGRA